MSNAAASTLQTKQNLLRWTFQVNGVTCTLMGILLAAGSAPIAERIGLDQRWAIAGIGLGLIGFAGLLFRNASGERYRHVEALAIMIGDFAWVIASGIVILLGILNTTGNWAAALVADVVLVFAILEWIGIRRMTKN